MRSFFKTEFQHLTHGLSQFIFKEVRKNGFAPIFSILIVLFLVGVGYLVYQNNIQKRYLPVSTQISTSNMIGVWQASGSLGAGWNDRYQFYSSGAYAFIPSQMKCDKTVLAEAGIWKLDGENLLLTKKIEISAAGGTLEVATGSCSSEKKLTNYTKKTSFFESGLTSLFNVKNMGTQEGDLYPSIYLNDVSYWKFNDPVDSSDLLPFEGFNDETCSRTTNPCLQ